MNPAPPRHRSSERVALVERVYAAATVHAPVRVDSLRHTIDGEVPGLVQAGPWVFSEAWIAELDADLQERIRAADPIDPGIPAPPEPWAADIVPRLPFELRGAKLYTPGATPSLGVRQREADALERELEEGGVRATRVEDAELARYLEASGRLVRLGDGYAIGTAADESARDVLLAECREAGQITLARFRTLVGIGRRDAQLLLERFDADGLTRRVGDARASCVAPRASNQQDVMVTWLDGPCFHQVRPLTVVETQ